MPSLVVTLGTLYVIRGIDAAWAGGNQIASFSLPDSFNKIGYGTFLGVPYLAIDRDRRRRDRDVRDARVPDRPRLLRDRLEPGGGAARGHPASALRVFLAFVLSGAIAGFAGALWLSYFGSVDAIAGAGYEFQVIAAVVVGGVAIFGGSGTVLGAALGALLLNTIDSALVVVKVSSNWNLALAGALLLGAIAFDRLIVGPGRAGAAAREGGRVAEPARRRRRAPSPAAARRVARARPLGDRARAAADRDDPLRRVGLAARSSSRPTSSTSA